MLSMQIFEQSIEILATATVVENCVTDIAIMHRWLNPALKCQPIGEWDTKVGSKSKFIIQVPLIQPTLISTVVERQPGLVVWQFQGFFEGRDRWECQPNEKGTLLINRFEFKIPNPIVKWGFENFAEKWTKKDMRSQLRRLKQVAERMQLKANR
ncbi:MAG: SRPBCC family protein [Cyanobacteria bacterium P01_A01_bin.68]